MIESALVEPASNPVVSGTPPCIARYSKKIVLWKDQPRNQAIKNSGSKKTRF